MFRLTAPHAQAPLLGLAPPPSRRRRRRGAAFHPPAPLLPAAALPGSDPSGVDGGGDLDVGLFVRSKSGGGGGSGVSSAAPAAAAAPPPPTPPPPPPALATTAPPPPPPPAALPKELVDAGVTAIHTNLPIPGATRADGGPGGGGGLAGPKPSSTAAGGYAHSAMADGGAGFWYRATNNASAAPRMFWDRLGDGFAWRNKPTRASGDGGKPAFVAGAAKPGKVAVRKGFGAASEAAAAAAAAAAAPPTPSTAPAWFTGGTTSLAWNAVDRHVEAGQGDRLALVGGEGEGSLTFGAAAARAAALAAWLRGPGGVGKGDAVGVLLPGGPTSGVAALAASRAGCAVLAADPTACPTDALAASLASAAPRVVITSSPAKAALDAAIAAAGASSPSSSWAPDTVLVYEAGDVAIASTPWACGRDVWAHAALEEEGGGGGGGSSGSTPAAALPPPAWVEAGAPGLLLASASDPATLFVHPTAGYCVGGGATARLAWDVRAGDVVAVAAVCGSPTAALGFWGALLNCAGVAAALPRLVTEGSQEAVSSSASAWLRAAAAARATHVIVGSAAAARALAAADPAAITAAVAAGLRLVSLTGPDPDPRAVEALEAALPATLPLTAAWLPDGAGTPPLAGVPGPAAPVTSAGLRPFLRAAGDWTTAWPAVAAKTVPAGAWAGVMLDGSGGGFAQRGVGWVEVEGGDGEVVWGEGEGGEK